MSGLSDSQFKVIRTLIDTAPDSAIRSLDTALSTEHGDGAMGAIRDLVSAEAGERRARLMSFGPLSRLCLSGEPLVPHTVFPARILALLWIALKAEAPQNVAAVMAASAAWSQDEADPAPFDALCVAASAGLRVPAGTAFSGAADLLAGDADRFADFLDLVPLTRRALQHLPDWLGRMTDERAASVRLAFRDAGDIAPDAGPRYLEMLLAQLDEPWQILRVISAVMDRPNDSYMAGSELAELGGRLLADIDRRLDDLRAFDPQQGAAAGVAAAEAARIAVLAINEFEQSLDLKRDGPWGLRIGKQKRELAQAVESRFGKADDAVGGALPLKTVRSAGRMMRGFPKLIQDPEPKMIAKAEGLLAFLDETRASAPNGGYASLRAKVVEKVEARLDQYAEDLIEVLRDDDSRDHERARLYLELTANFVAYVRDEKAAQIVRRRAAA
jgi:hypothetical protein